MSAGRRPAAEGAGRFEIVWRTDERPLADGEVERTLAAALAHGGRAGAGLAVVLAGDEELRGLHAEHLDDPTPTDVLAFDLGDEGSGPIGELYVSVERARAVAATRGVDPGRELALYLVHGALHLCGFDDREPADRARMRGAEATVLGGLGYPDDPGPHDAVE